jgi:hypothetical protein
MKKRAESRIKEARYRKKVGIPGENKFTGVADGRPKREHRRRRVMGSEPAFIRMDSAVFCA